ncbi:glucuronate isomerase [Siphonobacter aquaeclarae]|uniref:Uronate isomerase n=1 Tax=Siphonobacter aquaeclarae TaxID=563176 RepID=A0A1G9RVM8_9BACT|nr:glucuronate isomerase [Siphonobacter aquaeclarae]SDM27296.1 D-glucuronate isomerase [Siphonobacter aquaeclarae]
MNATLLSVKPFLSEDFLLQTETARVLYHDFAREMPIIDYHCHLPPDQIAEDRRFANLSQIWLYGDHYKWRAMRTNGVSERYCTGEASDFEKFEKWAETVPYTMRNPLYHWTHLELQRYFNIDRVLNPASAKDIYDEATSLLQTPDYSVRNLLRRMNVEVVCTTDDPTDDLRFHQQLAKEGFEVKVLPTFRPDKAMLSIDDTNLFNEYVDKVEGLTGGSIATYDDYVAGLRKRHDFFASLGGRLSDHGLEQIYSVEYTESEIRTIFAKARSGQLPTFEERQKFKSAMLIEFALMDWEKGWTQQYHLGALRNNNTRLLRQLGPDTGWDSIGDFDQARPLATFLGMLDNENKLAKTILYNLNPAHNDVFATMIGNFNDGTLPGKIQWGSGWWFLDQKDGMEKQMNTLSNMGLLSRFLGMLTDSRSFLSYPRHEYFRRILCNLIGNDVENGELPADLEWLGQMVQNICYHNAKNYFQF